MKKTFAILLATLMLLGTFSFSALAEADTSVYVTIADDKGQLVLAQQAVSVTDIDNDGALTINDALYVAHEENFEGGAAAGYSSAQSEYGLSLVKLWGVENGGSYGYYVNNASAMGLTDAVKTGDHLSAYAFTDLDAWSDTYCYFDKNSADVKAGEEIALTLSMAGYDESWAPITIPVEGAVITLNGETTEFVTDAEGKVTVTIKEGGDYIISATSEEYTLVPPVCKVAVEAEKAPVVPEVPEEKPETDKEPVTPEVDSEPAEPETEKENPKTGDASGVVLAVALAAVCLSGGYLIASKKSYEN